MGQTVCRAVLGAGDLALVAAVDPQHAGETVEQSAVEQSAGEGSAVEGSAVEIASDLSAFVDAGVEVAVDFTVLGAARKNVPQYAEHGIHAVVGTTGFTAADLDEYARLFEASAANAIVAPNFTIGAVLMMRFAEMAAPWFESAEIIELHHDRKIDAPSGTAVRTAQRMAAASSSWTPDPTETHTVPGARGATVDGIPVHSVRLRGVFAHQEVVLGTAGQTLTIRHDSFDRDAYMPGVLLAVREVAHRPGLTIGLDPLLGV